jgi:integrase
MTREHIRMARIERTELLEGTDDLMPFDFRSWRTTGCTWHAMLGVDSWALARWAGHKTPETTWMHYAKEGPDVRRRHGEPFPAARPTRPHGLRGSG